MTEALYWASLTDLAPTVVLLPADETCLMLLERIPAAWVNKQIQTEYEDGLCLKAFVPQTDFNLWERGRIFNTAFELRWLRSEGAFQAVYCGPLIDLPGFQAAEKDLTTLPSTSSTYFLWGKRVEGEKLVVIGQASDADVFVEVQSPRLLHYPVSAQARRVKLQVREYRDARGELVYHRFQRLEEINESL